MTTRMPPKSLFTIVFCLLICLSQLSQAEAQTLLYPPDTDVVIDEIKLSGNKKNADEDLLYYIKQRKGSPLSLDVVSEDVKRLYRMKLYDDIQVDLDTVN